MKREHIFLITIGVIFAALTALFTLFPRSRYSELEKRELTAFPEFSADALFGGSFTRDVSSWFSDSEPYRDRFLAFSMMLKDNLGLKLSEEDNVTFHAESAPSEAALGPGNGDRDIADIATIGAAETAKVAAAGIIVAGREPNVRAMMVYGGLPAGGAEWAATANFYRRTLGKDVNIYCMVIPTPIEYYCPDRVRERSKRQLPTIRNIYSKLDDDVCAVDVYTVLGKHASEAIYHRTDHHWTPLGAYYAAQKVAQLARVPFAPLNRFDRHVRPGFVGSMYGYSKDIAVRNSPEDFVWFTPKDSSYTTTYVSYSLNSDYKVTGKSAPIRGELIMSRTFTSGTSYSMFLGGDARLAKIVTRLHNGRRLVIIKDSFGNALPPFFLGSFEQIHVVDHRYFTDNLKRYIRDNKITDVLIVNNIFNAYSPGVAGAIKRLLTQQPGSSLNEAVNSSSQKEETKKNEEKETEDTPQPSQTPATEPATEIKPAPKPELSSPDSVG